MADVGIGELVTVSATVIGIVAGMVRAMVKPHTDKVTSHATAIDLLEKDIAAIKPEVRAIPLHDARLHSLEKDTATKADLAEHSRTIIKAIADGNSDIIMRIGAVDRKADEAHKRINDQQQAEIDRLRSEARANAQL
jgi:hypothetical protein